MTRDRKNFSTKEIQKMTKDLTAKSIEIKDTLEEIIEISRIIESHLNGSISQDWKEAINTYQSRKEVIDDKINKINKNINSYVTNTLENEKVIMENVSVINDELNKLYNNLDDIDV